MAIIKILRNVSGSEIQILNRQVADGESYAVQYNFWLDLAEDEYIRTLVLAAQIIVNDGIGDLDPSTGASWIKTFEPSSFSYNKIPTNFGVIVPDGQQMVTYQQLEIDDAGSLTLDGELILIE